MYVANRQIRHVSVLLIFCSSYVDIYKSRTSIESVHFRDRFCLVRVVMIHLFNLEGIMYIK